MAGNSVGTLSMLTNDIGSNVLWLRNGHQGSQWKKGMVRIGSRRNFQVIGWSDRYLWIIRVRKVSEMMDIVG